MHYVRQVDCASDEDAIKALDSLRAVLGDVAHFQLSRELIMPILQNPGSRQPISPAPASLIEIESLAESVLGSRAEAQDWLNKPALALDGFKPMVLIATPSGAELVKQHLIRLDYGVTV